jgi:hypothetical protein
MLNLNRMHVVMKLGFILTSVMNSRLTSFSAYLPGTSKWVQCIQNLVLKLHMLLFVFICNDQQGWSKGTRCMQCLSCQYTTILMECIVDAKVVSWILRFTHIHPITAWSRQFLVCYKFELEAPSLQVNIYNRKFNTIKCFPITKSS